MKTVSILGATGSIGRSTADVIASQPDQFSVEVVTAHTQAEDLAATAKRLGAKRAVIADEGCYEALSDLLAGSGIECAAGEAALDDAASIPVDWTMAAILGMAGLPSLMRAIDRGGVIAIANKEPLVSGGPFVMNAAKKSGATILPVDSEHNAVFQVWEENNKDAVERIILTASGGPFRATAIEDLEAVTPAQALAHPTWAMGHKISIDSSTMMNKALEVIEAHVLYNVPGNKIDVVIHPQSVVHSMVEYADGSILAQLGASDMCTPIAHTLAYPARMATPGRKLDLTALRTLSFEPVDTARFPAIPLAYDCLKAGLPACIAANAANEVAVAAFLGHKIAYLEIVNIVREAVEQPLSPVQTLDDVFALDQTMREWARSCIVGKNQPVRKVS